MFKIIRKWPYLMGQEKSHIFHRFHHALKRNYLKSSYFTLGCIRLSKDCKKTQANEVIYCVTLILSGTSTQSLQGYEM